MGPRHRSLAATALAGSLLFACAKAPPAPEKLEAASSPSALALASSVPNASSVPSAAPVASSKDPQQGPLEPHALGSSPCRVLRVKGAARVLGGEPLAALSPLDGKAWLELAAGADVSIRHGATSREFSLQGPGRFLACRLGLEQVLISEGGFMSSRGSGVRPGAEMWVATPVAALHYGDVDASVRVERAALRVHVASGSLMAEVSSDDASKPLTLAGPNADKRWPFSVVTRDRAKRCEASARKARTGADQVLAPTVGDLGQLAAAQLESRRRARAECLIAETSLERTTDPAEKSRLSDQVAEANRLWQGIPAMLR